ncbi:deoxyribonuclease IV [Brevibacillus nitrificans]|jgi:deoxyribonuclease-4|uniref:deoxyribonuclease IV n=1 Tax=Brevibacillus nitrificans TaxID=651560 RepID=UPI0026220834|nr:deoxyribonuclease IV [Brevibacillus nitrificans]MED1794094.1 deoxyribonuclease IV [Brevibacillus nitrificans]
MKIGSHVSIRNGYEGAALTAYKLGAKAFQFFPKNPRSLGVKSYDERDAEACRSFCRQKGISSIAHTPYTVNLCAEDPDLFEATIASVQNDLQIAEACGAIGVVVHFGHYKGSDILEGYKRMITMINRILTGWQGQARLLVENNAGQGNRMGTTLEELTQVRLLVEEPEKVGFCLDTCHAFASGMWKGNDWEKVAGRMRELDFFASLRAVHLNDSLYPTGSFRDRHANIGQGEIGDAAFAAFLRTPELQDLPLVLETPKQEEEGHREEIKHVQALIDQWQG